MNNIIISCFDIKRIIAGIVVIFILLSNCKVEAEAQTIELGEYYYIASALNTTFVVDVSNGSHRDGANIQLYSRNGTDAQLWKIEKSKEDGYFYFVNKGSGKVLDVAGGGTESETNVQLYTRNDTAAQMWALYRVSATCDDIYIVSQCGKFLDASGGKAENGTNVWIYDMNKTLAQRFVLIPYVNTTYTTVELEFDSVASWMEEVEKAQNSIVGISSYRTNPSGNTFYAGKIITGIDVLSWKTIEVKVPVTGPGDTYKYQKIELPSKIRYKLHSHNDNINLFVSMSKFTFWQSCTCGYHDIWEWEIPWPDLTPTTDTQTSSSVIEAIKPVWKELYTVR